LTDSNPSFFILGGKEKKGKRRVKTCPTFFNEKMLFSKRGEKGEKKRSEDQSSCVLGEKENVNKL